jgi:aspartate aminotransferase-like enzyme
MRLWIPGPTHVRPELLAECARPMIGHRSGDMTRLIERLDPHLRLAFGLAPASEAVVGVHSTSATGLMEAGLLGCGPRVLALVTGAFGARWREIAELVGKQVVALEAPWGQAVQPAELERALATQGPFDAVALVSNETSTGVRAPLDDYAGVLSRHPGTLLLVDLVSWIAGAAVDFDARRMDFAFAGTQKALALPPGVSVVCASRRYLERARGEPRRGFFLDPVRILEGHVERKTPSTPCIPLYYALARQLEDISAAVVEGGGRSGVEAWQARFARHERMLVRTVAWAAGHGIEPLPAEPLRSPTVSCLRADGLDVPALLAELKRRGHQAGNGYGKLKDVTFRFGHMGDHTEADLEQLLAAASEALARQGR